MVLVGAGASYDCSSRPIPSTTWQPPLVKDLFAERFAPVVDRHPYVQTISAKVRRQAVEGAEPLEEFIRLRLLESPSARDRMQFWSLPRYLKDLLETCSRSYTEHADHYDLLADEVLKVSDAMIVSLNYDTLLDRELSKDRRLETLDSYLGSDWSLVKLHGSVNWRRRAAGASPPELVSRLAAGSAQILDEFSHEAQQPEPYWDADIPAIAVPAGPEDGFSCPPAHVEHLRRWLRARRSFSLLVVGYRCFDQGVLRLISESEANITRLLVANGKGSGSSGPAREAVTALQAQLGPKAPDPRLREHDEIEEFDGGFGELVATRRHATFFEASLQADE